MMPRILAKLKDSKILIFVVFLPCQLFLLCPLYSFLASPSGCSRGVWGRTISTSYPWFVSQLPRECSSRLLPSRPHLSIKHLSSSCEVSVTLHWGGIPQAPVTLKGTLPQQRTTEGSGFFRTRGQKMQGLTSVLHFPDYKHLPLSLLLHGNPYYLMGEWSSSLPRRAFPSPLSPSSPYFPVHLHSPRMCACTYTHSNDAYLLCV